MWPGAPQLDPGMMHTYTVRQSDTSQTDRISDRLAECSSDVARGTTAGLWDDAHLRNQTVSQLVGQPVRQIGFRLLGCGQERHNSRLG